MVFKYGMSINYLALIIPYGWATFPNASLLWSLQYDDNSDIIYALLARCIRHTVSLFLIFIKQVSRISDGLVSDRRNLHGIKQYGSSIANPVSPMFGTNARSQGKEICR